MLSLSGHQQKKAVAVDHCQAMQCPDSSQHLCHATAAACRPSSLQDSLLPSLLQGQHASLASSHPSSSSSSSNRPHHARQNSSRVQAPRPRSSSRRSSCSRRRSSSSNRSRWKKMDPCVRPSQAFCRMSRSECSHLQTHQDHLQQQQHGQGRSPKPSIASKAR